METTTSDEQPGELPLPNISPLMYTTKVPSRKDPSGSSAKDRVVHGCCKPEMRSAQSSLDLFG